MAIRYVIQTISTFYCFWITAGVDTSNCTVYDLDGRNRNNVLECGSPGIISCKLAAHSFLLQWFIADPILPSTPVAALCSGTSCTSFNNFSGRYTYSYNPSGDIANITIRNISSADRGLKYKFNDGILPQIFEPITKVFPDKITTSINFTDDKGTQNVTVSTDCTLLAKNITFVWQKTRNSSGTELEPLTPADVKHTVITNLDDTICASTHTCGKIIFTSTFMFIPGNSGDAYHLHCTVVVNDEYGPPNKIWISSKAYQFKEFLHSKTHISDDNKLGGIIGGSVVGGGGGIVVLIILLICCCNRGKCCKCGHGRNTQNKDTDNSNCPCCYESYKYCRNFRVNNEPVAFEPIGLHTAARETSITCTWDKEFKSNTVVHLLYTNTETIEKGDRELTADEKQKRSCTIRNLQPLTTYSLVLKASESSYGTVEKEDLNVRTLALKPPKRFEFISIEDDKITVSWEPALLDTNQIFRLTFYNMVTKRANEKAKEQTEVFVEYQKPVMIKTVTGLQKNTVYQFEILTCMGKKRSISLIDFVQTTGTKAASETKRTGPKLKTTVHHVTL